MRKLPIHQRISVLLGFHSIMGNFCLSLQVQHVMPGGNTNSYCGFLDNQTIPFVPSSMDSRWSLFAFQVS